MNKKYDVELEQTDKKRFSAVEKVQRTLREAEQVDSVVAEIIGDLRDAVEPILQVAQSSNSKMVQRQAIKIATKLNKILGDN